MTIHEIYLQEARYNPRIRATVYGAWMAVLDDGIEIPICRPWEAASADEARAIYDVGRKSQPESVTGPQW